MKKTAIWIALALYALANGAYAEDISLNVTSQRKQIYLGESFQLNVSISGADPSDRPDTSEIRDCRIDYLGSQRSFSFEQSGRYVKRIYRRVYQYQVTPDSAGVFRAGPVKVNIKGKTYHAPGPLIKVTGIEEQDDVIIRIFSSRESVLVDEPFEVTLSIAIKAMPGEYSQYDPLDRNNPPHLSIPYLEPNNYPQSGLESERLRPLLERLVISSRNPGFSINDHRARFGLQKRKLDRNGKTYCEYTLTTRYTPKLESSYQFGPVIFKGRILAGIRAGQLQAKTVFAVGPACTVRVIPPPDEGRPDSYCGAVGKGLIANAQLDIQTCIIGDPLTLTLTLTGDVNARSMYPPVLSDLPDLTRNFRTYDDTVRTRILPKGREYEYTIRPIRDGTFELPAIPVSFFDRASRQYKTVYTKPIPIRANASAEFNPENIVGPSADRILLIQKEKRSSRFVPAPLAMSATGFISQGLGWKPWHRVVGVSAPLFYFILLAGRSVRRRSRKNAGARRQRGAASGAIAIIRKAERAAKDNPTEADTLMLSALRQYISDRFLVPASGVTPGDARALLKKNLVPQELSGNFAAIMEKSFNAGFSSRLQSGTEKESDAREAERLLREVDAHLSKAREEEE